MTGKNPDEIVVGANGSIYSAPLGSEIPASIAAPLGDEWYELGYATEDGGTFTDGKTLESIRAWQSFYDLRRVVSEKNTSVAFSLMQWNDRNFALAFGGGEITSPAEGAFRYVPPAPGTIDDRMLAIEWSDGDKDYRLVLPKGMVADNVETQIVRTAAAVLPITFTVLGSDELDPWVFDTNDPAFDPSSGS